MGNSKGPRPTSGDPCHPLTQAMTCSSCPLSDMHTHTHTHTLTPWRGQAGQTDTPKSDPNPISSPRRRRKIRLLHLIRQQTACLDLPRPQFPHLSGKWIRWFIRPFPALTLPALSHHPRYMPLSCWASSRDKKQTLVSSNHGLQSPPSTC